MSFESHRCSESNANSVLGKYTVNSKNVFSLESSIAIQLRVFLVQLFVVVNSFCAEDGDPSETEPQLSEAQAVHKKLKCVAAILVVHSKKGHHRVIGRAI